MGIHGLLPFLKPLMKVTGIHEMRNKTVGVDAMCWMHKGAFAQSQELVQGKDSDKFIHFFIKMCEVMRYHQVKPIIVFDGARLPAKLKEESERQDTRATAMKEALELLERKRMGEPIDERLLAAKCGSAIRVTGAMISRLMEALRQLSIQFIVAPFEADAQLAYMCRRGWVHAVISEDSDLLAYGCPRTLFKMDQNGACELHELSCLQPDSEAALAERTAAAVKQAELDDEGLASASDEEIEEEDVEDVDRENRKPEDDNSGACGEMAVQGRRGRGRGRGRGGRGGRGVAAKKAAATGGGIESGMDDLETDGVEGDAIQAASEGNQAASEGKARGRGKRTTPVKRKPKKVALQKKGSPGPAIEGNLLGHLDRWTPEKFAQFCVLLGTDYHEQDVHIKGFGAKNAFALMSRFPTTERMFHWMRREKRWCDKFPCGVEEYLARFRSVVAVFWHHVVYNPMHGMCVSIAEAFPHADRMLVGVDLAALVGHGALDKLDAKRMANGEVDPRSMKEREKEQLTPAERSSLDRILTQKRSAQRQYCFEQQLKADADRHRAEEAEQQRLQSQAPPATQTQASATQRPSQLSPTAPDQAGWKCSRCATLNGDKLSACVMYMCPGRRPQAPPATCHMCPGRCSCASAFSQATPRVSGPNETLATEEFDVDTEILVSAEEVEQKPEAPRELCLLPGDLAALSWAFAKAEEAEEADNMGGDIEVSGLDASESMTDDVLLCGTVTPPPKQTPTGGGACDGVSAAGASGGPAPKEDASTPAAPAISNPFARKRVAGANSGLAVLAKRPKEELPSFAPTGTTTNHKRLPGGVAGSDFFQGRVLQGTVPRVLAPSNLGSRGGNSAIEAAQKVLAQRGAPELEALPERLDPSKITSFFGKKPMGGGAAKQDSSKKSGASALAGWRAQPWRNEEEEAALEKEQSSYSVGVNLLKMRKDNAMPNRSLFRKGWESGSM